MHTAFSVGRFLRKIAFRRVFLPLLVLVFTLPSLLLATVNGVMQPISTIFSFLEASSNIVVVELRGERILYLDDLLGSSPPSARRPSYVNVSVVQDLARYLQERGFPVNKTYCVLQLEANMCFWGPLGRYLACESLNEFAGQSKATIFYIHEDNVSVVLPRNSVQDGSVEHLIQELQEYMNVVNATIVVGETVGEVEEWEEEWEWELKACRGELSLSEACSGGSSFSIYVVDGELFERVVRFDGVSIGVVEGRAPMGDNEVLLPIIYKYNRYVGVGLGESIPIAFNVFPGFPVKVFAKVSGFAPIYSGDVLVTSFESFENMFNVSRKVCNIVVVTLTRKLGGLESVRFAEAVRRFFAGKIVGEVHVGYPFLEVERVYRGKSFTAMAVEFLAKFSPFLAILLGVFGGYMVSMLARDFAELLARYGWSFTAICLPAMLAFTLSTLAGLAISASILALGWNTLLTGTLSILGLGEREILHLSTLSPSLAYHSLAVYTASYAIAGLLAVFLLSHRLAPFKTRGGRV